MGTQDEEAEEEPADNLQRRQRRSDVEQQGDRSGPEKDNTPISRSEGQEPRQETRLIWPKAVAPVLPEPVTELHISPGQ